MGCISSKKKAISLPLEEPVIIAGYLVLSGLKKKSFGKGRWYLKVSAGEENFQTETKHADWRNNTIDWDDVFRIFVEDGKETELEIRFELF